MYQPKKVFIWENDAYKELSYEEFCHRRDSDPSYADKRFLLLQGCLLEADEEHYTEFYQYLERWYYLKQLDRKHGLLSIDAFDSDDDNGDDYIPDSRENVADAVIRDEMLQKLRKSIALLPEDERLLIRQHFFEGKSQADLGKMYSLHQSTISRRIAKILLKLKKFLEK